jgi:hypothetical protein
LSLQFAQLLQQQQQQQQQTELQQQQQLLQPQPPNGAALPANVGADVPFDRATRLAVRRACVRACQQRRRPEPTTSKRRRTSPTTATMATTRRSLATTMSRKDGGGAGGSRQARVQEIVASIVNAVGPTAKGLELAYAHEHYRGSNFEFFC